MTDYIVEEENIDSYSVIARDITHRFEESEDNTPTLEGISFDVKKGEFITILGHNGCGKSTLARHMNALIHLQEGELNVAGFDVRDKNNLWDIRRSCGMVFQNPENQFVSSVIEEDLAFGPDNYDIEPDLIDDIIKRVLKTVGMSGYEKKSPHLLSGGQKQRIAIAGVLAVDPDILILDEATSMLDPEGRKSILELAGKLNREQGKTIIMITHYIEEALLSDKVILLKKGRILKSGTCREVLTDKETLEEAGLIPPIAVRIYHDLMTRGLTLPACPLTTQELTELICQ